MEDDNTVLRSALVGRAFDFPQAFIGDDEPELSGATNFRSVSRPVWIHQRWWCWLRRVGSWAVWE